MCGRYATFGPVSLSREAKDVLDQLEIDIVSEINQRDDQFNIAPTQKALVVSRGEKGYEAKAFRWGLVPSWAKDLAIGSKMINARADSIVPAPKPSFRNAFKKRRCLVPASGYFEWKGEKGNKQPYFIHDPAGDLLMFAGLWEGWRASQDDPWTHTFTIITGEPGKVSGDIHDRQPVILPPDLWQVWVEGSPDEASATLVAVPEAELVYYPVTKAVGKPTNHGAELVEPIAL
ncbi:putative SOS response-associated peptidase YedK [Luteibacter sp. 1214]|uniref:SOS response-associated peptidase n=1 Tax=Luteibacter sp. 1214 TaxID=2817735 RepID=UPI0028657F03|nr:SOS response-associated peptidase [Luteibacter sp. 1214]MDR6642753.1 putative SOS response-associated peptidase YedK [Luteibacter sp. 1214]